jgi:hypothetical protein
MRAASDASRAITSGQSAADRGEYRKAAGATDKAALSSASAFFKTQMMKSESVSSLRTATIGLSDLQ